MFDHYIKTDNINCSILLKSKELIKKRVGKPKAEKSSNEVYINELEDYKPLKDKKYYSD